MKLQPKQIVSLYFDSWWIPALLLTVIFTAHEMAARASDSNVPHWRFFAVLTVVLFIMLCLAFVGILSASLCNFIRKRWAKGFVNLLLSLTGGAVMLFAFTTFIVAETMFSSREETATPTTAQVDFCRTELHLNPSMKITPLGFMHDYGFGQDILFKFKTDSNDPSRIFDASVVYSHGFGGNFTFPASYRKEPEWWDVKGKSLLGGSMRLSERAANVGIEKQNDGFLVYIVSCF